MGTHNLYTDSETEKRLPFPRDHAFAWHCQCMTYIAFCSMNRRLLTSLSNAVADLSHIQYEVVKERKMDYLTAWQEL